MNASSTLRPIPPLVYLAELSASPEVASTISAPRVVQNDHAVFLFAIFVFDDTPCVTVNSGQLNAITSEIFKQRVQVHALPPLLRNASYAMTFIPDAFAILPCTDRSCRNDASPPNFPAKLDLGNPKAPVGVAVQRLQNRVAVMRRVMTDLE
jgi:hypothetical protein